MLWVLLIAAEPGADTVAKMRDAIKQMARLAEGANEKKDVVRGTCAAAKVAQAKGLLRIAEQSELALQDALAKKDREAIAHERQKLAIAGAKAAQLQTDAKACVGESTVHSGDTQVIVKFSGQSDRDPTVMTILDLQAAPLLVRPYQVSPYQ